MIELNDKQIAEYFYRCYTSVDGLWFMKVEEAFGFERALDIDNEVWKVLPKIKARFLKSVANVNEGMRALLDCLAIKLQLEGFSFSIESEDESWSFSLHIDQCPWHNLLVRSGRQMLSARIGMKICTSEYSAWASEFGENIRFELKHQICSGEEFCSLHFQHAENVGGGDR